MDSNALKYSKFTFENQSGFYEGKVRDVYYFDQHMAVVVSDRISAFDHVLPEPIPYKGQVLNKIASFFLDACSDIVPNWKISCPDPNVTVGYTCKPIPIEMVVRGYLAGHAWREYKAGKRILCGVALPEGLKESDKLPSPIITPATKATEGHDEDISREEIIAQGIVSEADYVQLEEKALALFQRGTEIAKDRGLILVDTKYEFGFLNDEIYLIDEIHTPDSSRYYYLETYKELQTKGQSQRQLSKEFVREWLIEKGFQGLDGQIMPVMDVKMVDHVTDRYIELYEILTNEKFKKVDNSSIFERIKSSISTEISNITT